MINAMEIIQKRTSVRTYSLRPLNDRLKAELEKICGENQSGPFQNSPRFQLLDLGEIGREELRKLGTYGVIKGAQLYILGAVREGKYCLEDLGYSMENVILEATRLGLGTCWLAGTFKRGSFARQMHLSKDELLPAITPVGYPAEHNTTVNGLIRLSVGANRRKPWEELFFNADGKTPLDKEQAGSYRDALEAVRLGPSATNRQPWRLVKDQKDQYHLYLKENRLYNKLLGKIRIQNIDMGIAMCHFELVARQRGNKGCWQQADPNLHLHGLKYIASWLHNGYIK